MSPAHHPVHRQPSEITTAMVCAGVVAAQFTAGKATRDALYLANLSVTSLPAMVTVTSIVSIALAIAGSRRLGRATPATRMPVAFIASSLLLLLDAALLQAAPRAAAVLLYLQISGLGPMFGSGFWLLAAERFDPRTAKRRFGQIAAGGTIGGLIGGLLAERVGATFGLGAMVPTLAVLSAAGAWQTWRLGTIPPLSDSGSQHQMPATAGITSRSGFQVLATAPHLRHLATVVLLGTLGAALVDYVFKVEAVAALGHGETLLRFFGAYYAVTSVFTLFLQTSVSRLVLESLGLTVATGAPSFALLIGGLASIVTPALGLTAAVRGGESVLRASFFRSGYELFYTPIPHAERRAAKAIIDVGVDRLGELLGAAIVQVVIVVGPTSGATPILVATVVCSLFALTAARQLGRGYVDTLQQSLLNRAIDLDMSDGVNVTSQTVAIQAVRESHEARPEDTEHGVGGSRDGELHDILALRSGDRGRAIAVLRRDVGMRASLVAHVLPLLAWDAVAPDVIRALRRVAEEHVGQFSDALIDPNRPFALRRRLARVLSVCVSQRACEALLLALDDERFEVRFEAARSLAAIREKNARLNIDERRIYEVVTREVTAGKSTWRSQLDRLERGDDHPTIDQWRRDPTTRGLAHVFTLLSLVLPAEPMLIAHRSLQTSDAALKGTALEYLEGVLPAAIANQLWPFLEDRRPPRRESRGLDDIVADLVRSHPAIALKFRQPEYHGA